MLTGKKMLCLIILAVLSAVVFATSVKAEIYMSVSGTVKDVATGKGIAGVGVVASDLSTKKNYSGITDSNGVYYIKLVPEGDYTLYAHPPAKYVYKPYTKTVKVERGKNVVNADFEMSLGGAVSGIVYKSDGITPLVNASLFALTNKGIATSSTGPDGKYILEGLVPESGAKIRLITYGYGMIEVNNVNIVAGQLTPNVNVIIPSGTSGIRGKVFTNDSVNIPIADAFVVMKGDTTFGITTTDSNGNYSVNGLPEGIYEATVFKIGYERKVLENIKIFKNQYSDQNYNLIQQPFPLTVGLSEHVNLNAVALKFTIEDQEYPEVELNYVGSGGCACISVSFTGVLGIGVSIGQAKCVCSQQCGASSCVSIKTVNTICTCFGLGLGVSGQLQGCAGVPQTGYTSFWGADYGPYSGSFGGGCAGGGVSLGLPLGLYWCSCYASVL